MFGTFIPSKRIARSLITVITLSFLQVIAGPIFDYAQESALAAPVQGTISDGTIWGGPGGGNLTNYICTGGVVTGILVSSTVSDYTNGFAITCRTFNDNGTLSATTTQQNIVTYQSRDVSDSCNAGQVAIGLRARQTTNSMVYAIGLICGNPMSQASPDTRTIYPTSVTAGTVDAYTCPSGTVLVGVAAKAGNGPDRVIPKCATYTGFAYSAVGAPTVQSTTISSATVSFATVTGTSDSALTYTLTATSTGGTQYSTTSSSSPITLTGLPAETSFTFSVTGSNAYGSSPATGSTSVSLYSTPETDTALSFVSTSSQYAQVADTANSPFDLTGSFTLEAWVNPDTTCSGDQAVIAKQDSYMMYCGQGYWKYAVDADGANWWGAPTTIKVEPGVWRHIAFTKSSASSSLLVYLDGVLIQTIDSGVTSMTPNDGAFSIGRYNSSNYFSGKIDDIRIYNSQRNASTVLSDMKTYATTTDSTLVAYYDCNQLTTSTTLFNKKSLALSSTNLTINASPTFTDVKTVNTNYLSAYTSVTFTRNYITANGGWRIPATISKATVIVAAGGGGGGYGGANNGSPAGAGGGGGVTVLNSSELTVGNIVTVTVGQGGLGGYQSASASTRNGQSSFFNIGGGITVLGGGGGGDGAATGASGSDVATGGGSGGSSYTCTGASAPYSPSGSPLTNGTVTSGYNGGYGIWGWGGSGGGARGAATNGVCNGYQAGLPGIGYIDPISGKEYGRGGWADAYNTTKNVETYTILNNGSGGLISYNGGNSDGRGYSGASGSIIVRWINASAPIFTQPVIDTTTAGLTDSFTVSNNPIGTLTRNFQWQYSSDTGTTWSNLNTGTGFQSNTYTTPTLETTTSGSRYRYRVIVTDSDTVGLFITDTSTQVYLVINPRITYSGSYTSQKYGSTHQDTFTVSNGTGTKSLTFSPNNRTGITWTTPVASTAVLTISATLAPGTYYETITATDTKGAVTTNGISIVVSKADTITVSAGAKSDTYTGSTLTFSPTFTVVGLKNSDTVTPVTYLYSGTINTGASYASSSTKPQEAGSYIITPVVPSMSDSYTGVTIETATLTINRAARNITVTQIISPLKYGSFTTFVSTPSAGASDGVVTYATATTDSCTVTGISIKAIKPSGTCSYTATISRGNNYETATSTVGTTTLAKADTITVQVRNPKTFTYTGQAPTDLPTVTITGLVMTDTATVIRKYSAPAGTGAFSYPAVTKSTTVPSDVETYTVYVETVTESIPLSTYYYAVVFETSTLTITQAMQTPLSVGYYGGFIGSSFPINVWGGNDLGAITESVTGSTPGTTCLVSAHSLTTNATTSAYCRLLITKAATRNYKVQTLDAQIYFLLFVPSAPTQSTGSGATIALNNQTTMSKTTSTLSIASVGSSGDGTYPVLITGTGFGVSSDTATTTVKFWQGAEVAKSDFVILSGTQIKTKIPVDAESGYIVIENELGSTRSPSIYPIP